MIINLKKKLLLVALFAPIMLLSSCSEEEALAPTTTTGSTIETDSTTTNEYAYVNNWILANMDYYYYWTEEIPEETDLTLEPSAYFESLLNTYDESTNPQGDRFSFISEDADELTSSLSGETTSTGMEYRLFYVSSTGNEVLAQIIYTIPGSPAADAGLQRGDMFTKVNGTTITDENYVDLLFYTTDMAITLVEQENTGLVETGEVVDLSATVLQEDPIFLDTVYQVDGMTVGYLVYNQFIPAPNNSTGTEYDDKLNEIFTEFKTQGVNELIVDLRYNPGGYVTSAVTLASLIGTGVSSNLLFFKEEYNDALQEEIENYYGVSYFNQYFSDLSGNIGGQISSVYFIVTGSSASSSELVINGLKPYMNVYLVGETTYGKNVGSITITDDDNSENNWALQPIVMKAYNSIGNSDYTAGFDPDIAVSENSELVPFGDTNDPMLGAALAAISGSVRFAAPSEQDAPKVIGSSISKKKVTLKKISSEVLIEGM
ncbi:S41 family peptidase [Flammeovirgaceae bacterium SG7u.111]|nr:S41 family peptidase [Flammeovirgaceae bacterium SG7u.132]WPO34062.1 S41 family peptidase [Flammeovirgaceae bacterium SG7u.111]